MTVEKPFSLAAYFSDLPSKKIINPYCTTINTLLAPKGKRRHKAPKNRVGKQGVDVVKRCPQHRYFLAKDFLNGFER
jgi:hypothetical protein